ncbi:LysM peptidoglycan-binding domain-containing protein [Puniceibacterium sp. IMCC21224]|uniref:LysM peptidoglycan-binding domain-containing protein n=1 Tax=Puniceibacterium sp. IMCC21224 TaxID=1618204 RepID=UPI00064DC44C|nr:LysM peptidoglycan-binding domain-containing protein [Puniceibacterium sp. IMCC21224]KMK66930.1 metalloendopeptidase-like membrane protein [Puniceibacterium sp. IMCC21224]
MTQVTPRTRSSLLLCGSTLVVMSLAACSSEPLDFDLRGRMGGSVDTSQAARNATESRPAPDSRGILSYPNYQVAVAQRGDSVTSLAARVGLPVSEIAAFNGLKTDDNLRAGEIIALPRRVDAGSAIAPPPANDVIRPAGQIDITELASSAIERAPASTTAAAPATPPATMPGGVEPVRHQVKRGETAFTIARLYNVTPRALADWNGLGSDFAIREGQYLLIPVTLPGSERRTPVVAEVESSPAPGQGSITPVPPSASRPLPIETPPAASTPAPAIPKPDIGKQTASSNARMSYPVQGNIIREYSKGRNDGIDISASAGTAVKAAASGSVAAITTNTDNVPIVVIKHPDNLLTVYTHIDSLTVKKGDAVSRGQTIGKVLAGDPTRMHFEVRDGFDSVDPLKYLQ